METPIRDAVRRLAVWSALLLLPALAAAQCNQNLSWAVWNSFTGMEATGTVQVNNQTINVTMTANYTFDSTPGIYNYGVFAGFNPPPPNATVPRTTWAAGSGGETTMCFSQQVENPVLLLSSVGSPGISVTLEFSLPYVVLFDGGGMNFVNNTSLIGTEGYAIIMFPGDFTCVTIYSSTPENYTNITWGLNPPSFEAEIEGDTIACGSTTLTASGGTDYEWSGGQTPNSPSNTFTQTGTYFVTVTDAQGCTSVKAANVTIHPETDTTFSASICEGESYAFNGQDLTQPGEYQAVFQTAFDCDSTVTLNLEVLPVDLTELAESICLGESVTFQGDVLTLPGTYTATLQNAAGCDSTVSLTLTVFPLSASSLSATICQGETFPFNGTNLTQAGIYSVTLSNQYGCDSVVNLNLIVNPVSSGTASRAICLGDTLEFDGQPLTQPGTYFATFQNTLGCDSIVSLNLSVLPATADTVQAAVCQGKSYVFQSDTLNQAGNYTTLLQNAAGCDSTLTLRLQVLPVYQTPLSAQICTGQSYPFDGKQLNTAGTYTAKLQSAAGCDSTVTLTLSVAAVLQTALQESICAGESFPFGGQQLATAGVYQDTIVTAGGCDSVVTLTLTVLPVKTATIAATICQGESYDFHGQSPGATGQYAAVLTGSQGCDSILTLNLTVLPKTTGAISAQICAGQSYPFDGQQLTAPGTYTANLQSAAGCDSTLTLTLSVASVLQTTLQAAICAGEQYPFGGQQLGNAGTYLDTLASAGGCDSVVTLQLSVNPVVTVQQEATICEGERFLFHGDTLGVAGQYSVTLASVTGCDSLVQLQLRVSPPFLAQETASACDSFTWALNGVTYTQGGTYELQLQTAAGCDSVHRLQLAIHPRTRLEETVTATDLYTWPVNGSTYNASGTYTLTFADSKGCDSVRVLLLTIIPGTDLYIPNAFSPDLNGINDRFTIYGGSSLQWIERMRVYDRWGNHLADLADFPPNDPSYGWDGRGRDGVPMDPGVYIFTARLRMASGTILERDGEVILVK